MMYILSIQDGPESCETVQAILLFKTVIWYFLWEAVSASGRWDTITRPGPEKRM